MYKGFFYEVLITSNCTKIPLFAAFQMKSVMTVICDLDQCAN